jgi:hypothetical protein
MSQGRQACKWGEHQGSAAILEFYPHAEGLRRFPLHHPIQSIPRCPSTLIGGDETKLGGFSAEFPSD